MDSIRISAEDFQYQLEHIHQDKRAVVHGVDLALAIVTTIAVALRLCSRRMMKASLGIDDYATIISLVRTIITRSP